MGKITEVWYIKLKGAATCKKVLVKELTAKTVVLLDVDTVCGVNMRYTIEDITWIEQCVDTTP